MAAAKAENEAKAAGKAADGGSTNGMGGVALSKPLASKDFPTGPMLILWGSQTGTAERFGKLLMNEARQRGFDARSVDLEEYEPEQLAEEDEVPEHDRTSPPPRSQTWLPILIWQAPVVFLMATHGEGEPTDNAVPFYKFIEAEQMGTNLKAVRFAAFALGNKLYQHFGAMGEWVDAKLSALGAERICALGLGDDDDDLEGDFEAWRETLWAALCPVTADGDSGAARFKLQAPTAQFAPVWLDESADALSALGFLARAHPKQELYECVAGSLSIPGPLCCPLTVCSLLAGPLLTQRARRVETRLCRCSVELNRELTKLPKRGSVKHLELRTSDVLGGLRRTCVYGTADDLAVCPDNGEALAGTVARRLGLAPSSAFSLTPLPSTGGHVAPPLPTPCTVEQALRYHADMRAPVSKACLLMLADACTEDGHAQRLRHLASADGKADYQSYITRDGRGLYPMQRLQPNGSQLGAELRRF
jgi:NADPH-ferrihemoprotein reductase